MWPGRCLGPGVALSGVRIHAQTDPMTPTACRGGAHFSCRLYPLLALSRPLPPPPALLLPTAPPASSLARAKTLGTRPPMISALRRRVSSALSNSKAIAYGLKTPPRPSEGMRPVHRRFNTLYTPQTLRLRSQSVPARAIRHVHVRALSYSSIPRFMLRALRVPIGAATAGVGGLTYANYKFEGA